MNVNYDQSDNELNRLPVCDYDKNIIYTYLQMGKREYSYIIESVRICEKI